MTKCFGLRPQLALSAWTAVLLALQPAAVNAQARHVRIQTEHAHRTLPAKPDETSAEKRRTTINAWTVGLAGGLLEGAPIRLAAEIARVVDDGDNLHVLPVVTRGPTENVNSLLYLRGIDAAIINSELARGVQKPGPRYSAQDHLRAESRSHPNCMSLYGRKSRASATSQERR